MKCFFGLFLIAVSLNTFGFTIEKIIPTEKNQPIKWRVVCVDGEAKDFDRHDYAKLGATGFCKGHGGFVSISPAPVRTFNTSLPAYFSAPVEAGGFGMENRLPTNNSF
jgi:hypothetical protein